MHPIFLVLDVLREIGQYQATKDLGSVVRLSRSWYMATISLLWREVDFSILKVFGRLLESEVEWKFTVSVIPFCHVVYEL